MDNYKERACRRVDEILPELSELSDNLWHHPEYNFKEYFACESMSALLEKYGLSVETGVGGLETAVKAVYDSGKPGPNIGIFGEFDAVEGMGHSCGHNVMCAIAVGAGAAIREVIGDLGCADIPTLTVFNKCDRIDTAAALPGLAVSAKTGEGIEELKNRIGG